MNLSTTLWEVKAWVPGTRRSDREETESLSGETGWSDDPLQEQQRPSGTGVLPRCPKASAVLSAMFWLAGIQWESYGPVLRLKEVWPPCPGMVRG